MSVLAAEPSLYLSGRVKESLGKTDLTNAYVITYDNDGCVKDSVRANMGLTYRAGVIDTLSYFHLVVPRVDSTYVFDVACEGYKTLTTSFTVSNPGKRKKSFDMGIIYLDRAPIMLDEVTVVSSKIKFYNNGDTVVYNADAFQLAQGSMLDALIAQLPGVELNTNGQIKVNGEFVESLLLNGKQFFDGNNNLMLENIAAYTVKDIKVYEAPTRRDIQEGNVNNKVLTMNVQLKKEYNYGWLLNAQGGYGTDNRYLGRMFASWFNSTTRVAAVGNLNNLNSNQVPGRDDTWTPDELPDGTKSYAMGGVSYDYEHPEGKRSADGNFSFVQSINNVNQVTDRINFLPGGETYENAFGRSHARSVDVNTAHSFYNKFSSAVSGGLGINAVYNYSKSGSDNLSGAFSKNPGEMTREILDAIYSSGSEEVLETVLNLSKTQSDSWTKTLSGGFRPYVNISLPRSNDRLLVRFIADYSSTKNELWRDYDIRYGDNSATSERRRQFTDNSPNHVMNLYGALTYSTYTDHINLFAQYTYSYHETKKDSYMYALERLNDMGVYGVVPEGYLMALDPANSYASTKRVNEHCIEPHFSYNTVFANGSRFILNLDPYISLIHRKLFYWNNNIDHVLSRTYATIATSGYMGAMMQYTFNRQGEGRQSHFRNSVRYSYSVTPTLPEMVDLLDVVSDADPLNIYVGNPGLKTAWRHRHLFRWQYTPHSHTTFMNVLYLSFTHAKNSLTRGYNYNTDTGVRVNRMYNVSGNRTWALTNELSWQFGASKQFTLSSMTDGILATYNDMIGVNMSEPQKVTVKNNTLTENVRFGWQIGKQNVGLRCDVTARHTTSGQPGFNTINAMHLNCGVTGNFILPAGFSVSTDFTCYTRRGYGSPSLDTTKPVWNARLSYAPVRSNHWVFMLDGFDILHQLSNVNYSVTASGRVVSYTNVIPRYIMLSVQYRLNIQPRKR